MANKKTVVEMFEQIKSHLTDPVEIEFIEKRIEITQKKNASGKGGEPTPKQREKMAADVAIEDAIVSAMAEGVQYTPTDLLKIVPNLPAECNTQKLTPRLTALVKAERVRKDTVKGRSVYSLVVADEE